MEKAFSSFKRTIGLLGLGFILCLDGTASSKKLEVVVYKSPTCGCCSQWEDHMRGAGFSVVSRVVDDVNSIKKKHGVPQALQSCHTAVVDGLVLEGHVPARAVQKLLKKRPKGVKGLAVPGMPVGAPGMEGGSYREKYNVLSFSEAGKSSVFMSDKEVGNP